MTNEFIASSEWENVLREAQRENKWASILVTGTYKPLSGLIQKVTPTMVVLDDRFSVNRILLSEIKVVRTWKYD